MVASEPSDFDTNANAWVLPRPQWGADDYCDSNPCMNSAVCSASGAGFLCACAGGFTGAQCESPLFVSTWSTANSGTSSGVQITLPLVSSGTYSFTVYWGDGNSDTITAYDDAAVTHTYASSGTYTVSIAGTIRGWSFNNGGDCLKIVDVAAWGSLAFGSTQEQFRGCSNLDISAVDAPDLSSTTSLEGCFRDCSSLTNFEMSSWDTTGVVSMQDMFAWAISFNGNVSGLVTDSAENLASMMIFARSFTGIGVEHWNVSNVVYLISTFYGCSVFNGNVSQVCVMHALYCLVVCVRLLLRSSPTAILTYHACGIFCVCFNAVANRISRDNGEPFQWLFRF